MSEIYNAFRMLLVVAVIGVVVYFGAQIIPQVQTAATLPARIEADNARILAESKAAQSFVELQVTATRAAIENESLQAQAQANATTITAQGQADSARLTAQTWQSVAVGGLVIAGATLCFLFFYLGLRLWLGQRVHHNAIQAAQQSGSTLLLPNGHSVQFPQLGAPRGDNLNVTEKHQRQGAEVDNA